jgi:WhiB family transcriptional regulator, redox-sensing transcriptional regulator
MSNEPWPAEDLTYWRPRQSAAGDIAAVLLGSLSPADDDERAWMADAACATADPDAWFPEKGENSFAAKRICRACEVRPECLEYALSRNERFGTWGGKTERERRALQRQRERQAAA